MNRSEEDRDAEVVYSDYTDDKKKRESESTPFCFYFNHLLNIDLGEDRDNEIVYSDYTDD